MLASLVVGLLFATPEVRFFVEDGGTLTLMRQEGAASAELAHVTHDCATQRIVWSPDASRVLIAGPCQLLAIDTAGTPALVMPAPPLGAQPRLEFATDGSLLCFTEGTQQAGPASKPSAAMVKAQQSLQEPVHAWAWKDGAWKWLESGERAVGLDSLEGVIFSGLKTAKRVPVRDATLWSIIPPGGVHTEPARAAKPADGLPSGAQVSKDGAWAWTTRGTDACAAEAPVLVRQGKGWKTVLAPAAKPSETDCVRVQRVNGWLMLDPTWAAPVLVELAKGTVTALPENARGLVLLGTPSTAP